MPEDCVDVYIVDEEHNFSDDEEYFSAEEENIEMQNAPLSRDVATQTDPIMAVSACIVM